MKGSFFDNDTIGLIAEELKQSSVQEVASKFKTSQDTLRKVIESNTTLLEVYNSEERKSLFNKKKSSGSYRKGKLKVYSEKKLFKKVLDKQACMELSLQVLVSGVRSKDKSFFESGEFQMYQQFLGLTHEKDYYLDLIVSSSLN